MAEDSIRIRCPSLSCRRILAIPSSARGKTVRCKSCGTTIKVSGGGQASAGAAQRD